ncbi:MAG: murein tripeptide amidase MpaA [Gemmatimonadales bacterium]|nr:murein tripeptide amidase MpaA [Gemmatimonadales bacterium]NIN10048.1 murein tripeptide amidase MpaA [Gemmatimonadales bacterium]NIQ98701.1 murein tripeptide amidase MpaA [Gemmatimonadales bacterium]NIS63577.1 murein tripeptide amidase MpaA [Gemmatimonadales bacterium]
MNLRSRRDWGTLALKPDTYGRSRLGLPLEVWRPRGDCKLLLFGGIHGEEPETTFALSRALRQLSESSPQCAAVLAANPDGLIRGTRGNACGVDLNRNFPASDWQPNPVTHRSTLDDPSDVVLSPGEQPGSEPETTALMGLIEELKPNAVIALHAPLACIDEQSETPLGTWLAERTGLPHQSGVGYPTPGSFGSWGAEQGIAVVTYEFPLTSTDELVREHVPVLVELLTRSDL